MQYLARRWRTETKPPPLGRREPLVCRLCPAPGDGERPGETMLRTETAEAESGSTLLRGGITETPVLRGGGGFSVAVPCSEARVREPRLDAAEMDRGKIDGGEGNALLGGCPPRRRALDRLVVLPAWRRRDRDWALQPRLAVPAVRPHPAPRNGDGAEGAETPRRVVDMPCSGDRRPERHLLGSDGDYVEQFPAPGATETAHGALLQGVEWRQLRALLGGEPRR